MHSDRKSKRYQSWDEDHNKRNDISINTKEIKQKYIMQANMHLVLSRFGIAFF